MTTPLLANLLGSLVTALRADATLVAALGGSGRINNHAPQDTPLPHLVVRIAQVGDWSDKSTRGYELTLALDVWTRQPGDLSGMAAAAAAIALLDDRPSALTTTPALLLCQFSGQDHTTDPGGSAHFITLRFRVLWAGT